MQCIFCYEEREPTLEHVFPDAIGGTLTINRVCKPCNDKLGSQVDAPLVDHLHCKFKRLQYKIANRYGKVLSPHDVLGLGVLQDGSGSRIRIENHLESGRFNLRLITNQHPLAGENGEELINIRVDAANVEDVSKIVNRRRKELKLPPLTEEQMSSVTKDIQRQQIERPEVVHTLKVDLENYRRGIAKIAYEAAHLWLGDTFLEDKRARLLRHFILEGAEDSLAGTIGWSEEIPFGKAWSSEPDSHLVFIMRVGPSLTVGVRVFGALYAVVAVTENPELYAVSHNDNFYSWNPATQKARRGSLYEEFLRQSRLQLSQTPQD